LANHDNVGGIFRNAAAFGASAVLLDPETCDPLYRKAIRVSVGATLTVPFARVAGDLPVALRDAGFDTYALSPRGELDLTDLTPGPRAAALFGAEGPGLPRLVMDQVRTVRIPMAQGFDSLNVSTTSGLVLHQIVASRAYRDL
jgi:tRNA G18 (ribose-2'-O)-methylase SpoU